MNTFDGAAMREAARILYGSQSWCSQLSHRVGIAAGTIRRWSVGGGNPPHPDVAARIRDVLRERLDAAADQIRRI
jgi:hypothetical protein